MLYSAMVVAVTGASMSIGCQHDQPLGIQIPFAQAQSFDTALTPIADTYVLASSANAPKGSNDALRIVANDTRRIIVRFDTSKIQQALGIDSLAAAHLEFTIHNSPSGWGGSGLPVDLHRMTHDWVEASATWNCASDANTANGSADCSGATLWTMGSGTRPYDSAAAASVTVTNAQSGVIRFDVTGEVRALIAGTTHYGWLVKKRTEVDSAAVDLLSREGASAPQLVLEILPADSSHPALPTSGNLPRDSAGIGVINVADASFYSTVIGIAFDDSTSGTTIRVILRKYHAVIIGGLANVGEYVVQIPSAGSTIGQLNSLLTTIGSESGVAYAAPFAWRERIGINGRFPRDGANSRRTDWLSPTRNDWVRSRIQVRAPLAWGCETGGYSSTRTKVAVVDFFFSRTNPDLASNIRSIVTVPVDFRGGASAPTDTSTVNHGDAVAAVLTARGDNDTLVAGIVWYSDLYEFPIVNEDTIPADMSRYLSDYVFPMARDSSIRVMNLSISDPGHGALLTRAMRLERAMHSYIQSGGLIVIAAANDANVTLTRAALAALPTTNPDTTAPLILVAAAKLSGTADSSGIIVVSATDTSGHARWSESNFFAGLTTLAAPGEHVESALNDSASASPKVAPWNGTSFAAPMVAGAATLLFQMDPTQSPSDVRGYLVANANAASITGMAGTHLLDVYGALTAISNARLHIPLCGVPVSLVPSGDSLRFDRSAGAERVMFTKTYGGYRISVAQGGRQIAVGDPALGTVVVSQTGASVSGSPYAGVWREFLERDTAYVTLDSLGRPKFTIRRRDGSTENAAPFQAYNDQNGAADVSPTGDTIAIVGTSSGSSHTCVPGTVITGRTMTVHGDLVPVAGGTAQAAFNLSYDECTDHSDAGFWAPAWSHDSQFVLMSTVDGSTVYQTNTRRVSSGGSLVATRTSANFQIEIPTSFSGNDSLVAMSSLDTLFNCSGAMLDASSLVPTGSTYVCSILFVRQMPNSPPADPLRMRIDQRRYNLFSSALTAFAMGHRALTRSVFAN